MDFPTATEGGFKVLLVEALPSVAASALIFANAPDHTMGVEISVFAGTLYVVWDGSVSAAIGTGNFYGAGTYDKEMREDLLRKVKALGSGVTGGWITYWGRQDR